MGDFASFSNSSNCPFRVASSDFSAVVPDCATDFEAKGIAIREHASNLADQWDFIRPNLLKSVAGIKLALALGRMPDLTGSIIGLFGLFGR